MGLKTWKRPEGEATALKEAFAETTGPKDALYRLGIMAWQLGRAGVRAEFSDWAEELSIDLAAATALPSFLCRAYRSGDEGDVGQPEVSGKRYLRLLREQRNRRVQEESRFLAWRESVRGAVAA